MADSAPNETRTRDLLTPKKLAIQAIGFVIGLGLLAWIVQGAITGGDWDRLGSADPRLVAGLIGCSVLSILVNGTIFWLTIRPVRPLGLREMQALNLVTSVLNYAPIRAGLISRIAYHLRVDRMSLLQIMALLAAVSYTMLFTLGTCVAATIVRPQADLLWGGLVLVMALLGGLLTIALMGQPLVERYGRGLDRMLCNPIVLYGSIGLRLLDIGAFAGRMACAVAILDLPFNGSQILILAMGTLALSMNPLGRFGYREAGVAVMGKLMLSSNAEDLTGQMDQLALIESAGEAIVFIPVGLVCLIWYRRKWIEAGREKGDAEPA